MLEGLFWSAVLFGTACLFYSVMRHKYAVAILPALFIVLLPPFVAMADEASEVQGIQDALSGHANIVVGVLGGLALLLPIVLHIFGKDVPGLSPLIDGLMNLARTKLPSPENKAAEAKVPTNGLDNVVKLEEVKPKDPEVKS